MAGRDATTSYGKILTLYHLLPSQSQVDAHHLRTLRMRNWKFPVLACVGVKTNHINVMNLLACRDFIPHVSGVSSTPVESIAYV